MKYFFAKSTNSRMALSRRSFLALSAMLPWALKAGASRSIAIGLELYSVRDALQQDPEGTVRSVAKMGYECVEFYGPYFEWNEAQAKQIRQLPYAPRHLRVRTADDAHYTN